MIIKTNRKKIGRKIATILKFNAKSLNSEKYNKFFKLILFIHYKKKNTLIVKKDRNSTSL